VESLPSSTMPPVTTGKLLELLEKTDGCVRVVDPPQRVRAAWRSVISLLRSTHSVPDGWHLRHRGRDRGDLVVELRRGPHLEAARWHLTKDSSIDGYPELHPVIAALLRSPNRLLDSDDNCRRLVLLLDALCRAADARGFALGDGGDALIAITIDGQAYQVVAGEDVGTGWQLRLVLEVHGPGPGTARWLDDSEQPPENVAAEILAETRERSERFQEQEEAAVRARQRRRQKERQKVIDAHRHDVLAGQLTSWLQAEDIRLFCAGLAAAGVSSDDPWIVWARGHADSVDPLRDPPGTPADPPAEKRPAEPSPAMLFGGGLQQPPPARPWHPNRRWYHG
jgi:hypothetical protein